MATHKCPQNCPSPKFLSGLSPSYDLVSAEAPLECKGRTKRAASVPLTVEMMANRHVFVYRSGLYSPKTWREKSITAPVFK